MAKIININGKDFVEIDGLMAEFVDYLTKYADAEELYNSFSDENAEMIRYTLEGTDRPELAKKFRKMYLAKRYPGLKEES